MFLKDFEQHIDPAILDRGHSYFHSEQIGEVEELFPGSFEATVFGSVPYNVQIELEGNQITRYSCTCPYDYGPVCKHVVCLMYHIRHNAGAGQQTNSQKSSKRKTVSQQVDELLARIPREDLINFCRDLALKDKQYRRKLMRAFVHLNQQESKAFYAGQVRDILQASTGEFGVIGWNDVHSVANQINEFLDTAEKQAGSEHYKSAWFICFAVMEELIKELDYVDDSDGYIGDRIYRASEIIRSMASKSLPEPVRKQLFDECFSAIGEGTFSGWDWNLDMLEVLAKLYKTEEEAEHILGLVGHAPLSDYELKQAQRIQLQIIEDFKGKEEASQFITQHITNPEIRTAAIQRAIEKQQYDKAIAIAQDGIKHDSTDKPGLVQDWYRHLLNIAQLQNDNEKIITYARHLFINSRFEKQPYYEVLKEKVPSTEWSGFVEELITELQGKSRWFDFDLVAQIYINEQWWDRLFEWVVEDPTLEKVESYEKHLSKDYATELAALYEREILSLMKHNTGRKYYRKACRFINKMKVLGSQDQARQLVKKLKTTFSNRPAMIEELNRLAL